MKEAFPYASCFSQFSGPHIPAASSCPCQKAGVSLKHDDVGTEEPTAQTGFPLGQAALKRLEVVASVSARAPSFT